MIYVTSDLHFFHDNVIRYCKRPFENSEEMNDVLIENINKKVRHHDTLIILGDFSLASREKCIPILERLNGQLILVEGNHDRKNVAALPHWNYTAKYFEFKSYGYHIHCQHVPFRDQVQTGNDIFLSGHKHGTWGKFHNGQIDVGCDVWNYEPQSINTIIQCWKDNN